MNYYQILGVNQSATPREVEKAFKTLSGRNNDIERQLELQMAWTVLSDRDARAQFDHELDQDPVIASCQKIDLEVASNDLFTMPVRVSAPVQQMEVDDGGYHRHDHHHYVHQQHYSGNWSWTILLLWFMLPIGAIVTFISLVTTSR